MQSYHGKSADASATRKRRRVADRRQLTFTVQQLREMGKIQETWRPGLIARGIVTERAPANRGKQRAATYQFNELACSFDLQMGRYVQDEFQDVLPGVEVLVAHGKKIPARQKKLPGIGAPRPVQHWSLTGLAGDTVAPGSTQKAPDLVTQCRQAGDTVAPYSLIDSLTKSKPVGVGRPGDIMTARDAYIARVTAEREAEAQVEVAIKLPLSCPPRNGNFMGTPQAVRRVLTVLVWDANIRTAMAKELLAQ